MTKVKVLPVYPRVPDTFWGFRKTLKYVGKKSSMPPTGLLTAMAMLPEERFEAQRVVDLNVEPLTDEQIKNADIIATSTMIVQADSHDEVVDRAHFHGKKVIAGGPFVTTYPERTKADYIVSGEAEVTFPPFLEDLLEGTSQRVWTEKNVSGRLLVKLTRGGKVELTQTPLPRWDLLNLKYYFSLAIQYSRGCPFDCDFCDITKLFGKEPRTKTPEQMMREFNAIYDAGHRGSVFLVDDNFIGNRKNVKEFLPYVTKWQQERGYPFSLFTEASMNLAWENNEDILNGMRDAGFNFVFLGIESVDNNVLKTMKKGQNTQMSQLKAVRRIQKAGIEVSGGFIIGSDGEKQSVFDNLFNFIQEAGIPIPMPGLLTALKGTDLYKRLESEGRLREESSGNNTHDLRFNFEPQLDERTLIEGYKGLLAKLFDFKNYYDRCRTLQENIGKNPISFSENTKGISPLLRSIRKQLFAKGGKEYFKYLVGTALKNPSYIPEAVAQAIKLDHFQTITRATIQADDYIPHAETMYEQFIEKTGRIYTQGGKDAHKKLDSISRTAYGIIKKAERQYEKLHKDFRRGAHEALVTLKEKINTEIDKYKTNTTSD